MFDVHVLIRFYYWYSLTHLCSDRMVIGFTTTCAISVYNHKLCEFESRSLRGVLYTTLKFVTEQLATGQWFSPGTLVSSTNKTDRHDIAEMLSKAPINTITITPFLL